MNYVLWEKMDLVVSNKIYNLFIRNLFGLKGRASREEYIVRFTTMLFCTCIANIFIKFELKDVNTFTLFSTLTIVSLFLSYFLFIVYFAQVFFVTHRRLHDLNASGWWQLVTFIPFGQILMIGFIFFKGTQGVNRFGEVPNDDSKNHTSLKYNILVGSGAILLSIIPMYFINSLNKDKEYSFNASKLALEYYKKGDYEEALQGFNIAIDFTPNMLSLYSGRGAVFAKLNRFDEALNDYDKFIESRRCLINNDCDIGDIATFKKKIYVLNKQLKYKEAVELYDLLLSLIEKDTDDYINIYLSKANTLNKMESYNESLECVEKVLSLDLKNENALKIKEKTLKLLKSNKS